MKIGMTFPKLSAALLATTLAGAPVIAMAQTGQNGPASMHGSSDTSMNSSAPTQGRNYGAMNGSQESGGATLSQNTVRDAQQQLQEQGYYQNGKVDGVMGPQTRSAVQQFQQSKGMQANGQLDQQTLAALNEQGSSPQAGQGSRGDNQQASSYQGGSQRSSMSNRGDSPTGNATNYGQSGGSQQNGTSSRTNGG